MKVICNIEYATDSYWKSMSLTPGRIYDVLTINDVDHITYSIMKRYSDSGLEKYIVKVDSGVEYYLPSDAFRKIYRDDNLRELGIE